jgi:hypothetical protein
VLAGASVETWGGPTRWDAFVDISDDDGLTWRRTADIEIDHETFQGAGIIQPRCGRRRVARSSSWPAVQLVSLSGPRAVTTERHGLLRY